MTAKRFTLGEVGCYRTSLIVDDGRKIGNKEVVECLNNLHEEKEQLQSRINDYDVALKTLQGLTDRKLKENEQLKKELKDY